MKFTLLAVGKTDSKEIEQLTEIYTKRVARYVKFEIKIIPDLKKRAKLSFEQQKKQEADLILTQLNTSDFVVLLDENGKHYSSVTFTKLMNNR